MTAKPVGVYLQLHDEANSGSALYGLAPVAAEWQDTINDVGTGSVVLDVHDSALADALHRRVVRCYLQPDGEDTTCVFAFLIEEREWTLAAESGEEGGRQVKLSGRGIMAALEDACTYPVNGLDQVPLADHRLFTFASPDYDPVYEGWGWSAPTEVKKQDDPTTYWPLADGTNGPVGWPDPDAYWIWPGGSSYEPPGTALFRADLVLAADTLVEVYATGDNLWTLYLDGVPLLGDDANALAWQETRYTTIRLPAGTHVVGAAVENLPATGAVNPGGLLVSIYEKNPDDGTLGAVLLRSNAADWLAWDTADGGPVGWTVGAIIKKLCDEATARGVAVVPTLAFDQFDDTASYGWPTLAEVAVPIGAPLTEVIGKLVEQGLVEVAMDYTANGFVLQAWRPGSRGTTQPITIAYGANATTLTWTE